MFGERVFCDLTLKTYKYYSEVCKKLDFLKCDNNYRGPWKLLYFDNNQKTLKGLFINVLCKTKSTKKVAALKLNEIMKIIGQYYRALIIIW